MDKGAKENWQFYPCAARARRIVNCEHTCILRALVEHPQGNLEEIQQKTLQSTQEEPGGRPDRKA